MAVSNAMFIFEVVVSSVKSFVESRYLIIKCDFGDIFSLELKDPKQMHIVIPDPPPLPPDPPGKKKKPPKPKKPKKGKVEEPPPEPCIQSGQSVLFTSTAEFIVQTMKEFPMELSLWSKEDSLVFIGSSSIPWDERFITFLEDIYNNLTPESPVVSDDYNIFEEGTAKLMAQLGLQIKLSYLGEKVSTAFRTLSEDPTSKKFLYTGINSKTTSYMCTMKTTDEVFAENSNKIENNFTVDKPKPTKVVYADYKNAPGANLTFFSDGDYCCMSHADKPPESIYKAPETCPDIDHIVDYVRKIIVSCNDNMRMLTPRPAIRPRVKATDIDRLCYCRETGWPPGKLSESVKKATQSDPCPVCIDAGKRPKGPRPTTIDIETIRGPCGRFDCKIARDMRAFIEKIVDEDNEIIDLETVIGPCGSKSCTLASKIKEFIAHEGLFKEGITHEGLSTQCGCISKMQRALTSVSSCHSGCPEKCEEDPSSDEPPNCGGPECPFKKRESRIKTDQVYNVYYFTVELDSAKDPPSGRTSTSSPSKTTPSGTSSPKSVKSESSANKSGGIPNAFKNCASNCPMAQPFIEREKTVCSQSTCAVGPRKTHSESDLKCRMPVCPDFTVGKPSPADDDIVIKFDDIHNPCCVQSCDIAERIKDFIMDGVTSQKRREHLDPNPCYCDCECTFKFNKKSTYCPICGGFECLGEDMKNEPEYAKPHPCPIYHKLYDRKVIHTPNVWDDDGDKTDTDSGKTSRSSRSSKPLVPGRRVNSSRQNRKSESRNFADVKVKKPKKESKIVGKPTAKVKDVEPPTAVEKKEVKYPKYPYPSVPKHMGWNWTADDIPGMKVRPKWKPGAVNKILVRRYRAVREGIDIIAKKKRAMMNKKKKLDSKPALTVTKKDGEYTVCMEVFKKFSKERLLFQYPYEEQPPFVYSIGKTEEEKLKRQKKRQRKERREARRKSKLIQSTFRDRCQEICLKAYNQAIGLLPLPKPNDPECPCVTTEVEDDGSPTDSCSCSDAGSISSSDTDGDEWVIEFNPPASKYDPKAKHPPVTSDNESQYTYLDYRVKLLDKQGNQLPRFFKGPDGKQLCSDLGGFWGPGHVWLEINKDGFIGPDGRWFPLNFIGPDGNQYNAEEGGFVDNTGTYLKLGVDGFIDANGKWVWYRRKPSGAKASKTNTKKLIGNTSPLKSPKGSPPKAAKTDKSSSPVKSKPGSPPKAVDRKKSITMDKKAKIGGKNALVMNMSTTGNFLGDTPLSSYRSDLMTLDAKTIAKYNDIINCLQMCDEFCELQSPVRNHRACNTSKKRGHFSNISPTPMPLYYAKTSNSNSYTSNYCYQQSRYTGDNRH